MLHKAKEKHATRKQTKEYKNFLKFYKTAKNDLKEKGKITTKTLKIIENAKSE